MTFTDFPFDQIPENENNSSNSEELAIPQGEVVNSDKSPKFQPENLHKKSKSPRLQSPRDIKQSKKSISPRNPSPRPEIKKKHRNKKSVRSVEYLPVIDYIPTEPEVLTNIPTIKREKNEPIQPKPEEIKPDLKTIIFHIPKHNQKPLENKSNLKTQIKSIFNSTIYSTIILIFILFESIIMGFYKVDKSPLKNFNLFITVIDILYQIYFTIETILSIIIFKKQFFKSFTHIYILILIILNWIPYISGQIDSDVNIINVFRFIRPLWLYLYLPGIEKIKLCLKNSIKYFISILLFGILFYFIYGIIGVNIFNGKLNVITNPNYGITSFDNIGSSLIIILQYIILDGWSDILYLIEYNYGFKGSCIYFIILLIISGYFFFNIFTVLFTSFYNNKFELNNTKSEVIESSKENEESNKIWKTEYKPVIVNQMKLKLLKLYKNGNNKIINDEEYDIWKEELHLTDSDLIDNSNNNNNDKENDNDIELKKMESKENIKPESSYMNKSININTINTKNDNESIESTRSIREISNKVVNTPLFHIIMFLVIIFNIVTISLCRFDMSERMKDFTYYSDIVYIYFIFLFTRFVQ